MNKIMVFWICALIVTGSLAALAGPTGSASGAEPGNAPMYVERGTIRINGNADFTAANGVSAGDGSAGNPWIIEGWEINGTGLGFCIYVGNTTEHFVVQDCLLHGAEGTGGNWRWNSGIALYSVQNGNITENEVTGNGRGIHLRLSDGNTVTHNNATANVQFGIHIIDSDANEISENNASFATNTALASEWGIFLDLSDGNSITGNNASYNNEGAGIWLQDSNNNTITDNVAWGNYQAGIELIFNSRNNTIADNSVCHNLADGIWLQAGCDNNTISDNTVTGNHQGIQIRECDNITIDGNNISSNNDDGLVMDYATHSTISYNTLSSNAVTGFMMRDSSHNNTIIYNTISNSGWWGIRLGWDTNTRDNRVYCNNFINNNLINTVSQADDDGINFWNASYPLGGNYWSDHSGPDVFSGANQDIAGSDGFIDVSYTDFWGGPPGEDFYPRVTPLDFTPPTITGTTPADGATGMSTSAGTYVIEFSEAMNTSVNPAGNITSNLPGVTWAWDGSARLNGAYGALATSTIYHVNLTTNFTDLDGYNLTGDMEKQFTTMPPDIAPPASSVDEIAPYWNRAAGITVTATATDADSAVANVTLHYRYSTDNTSWNAWAKFGTDTAQPWSWDFNFPGGEGYYEIYSTAFDTEGNEEAAPAAADAICARDTTAPIITDSSPTAGTTGDDFTFQATVTDNMEVKSAHVIYRFGTGTETNATMINTVTNNWEADIAVPQDSTDSLEYRLAAVDSAGNWKTMAYTTTAVEDDDDPTADAGPDRTIAQGAVVTFDGSGSTDNIGIDNYTWTFIFSSTAVGLYGVSPAFNFTAAGNFMVTLTVSDAAGNSDTDTMLVTVTAPAAPADTTPPVADAGDDRNIAPGTTVTFSGAGSTDDVGIANYTWSFTYNGTVNEVYGVSPAFGFWTLGNYTVTLTVLDAAGNSDDDAMTVTVSETADEPDEEDEDDNLCIIVILIAGILLVVAILAGYKMMKGKRATDSAGEKDIPENFGADEDVAGDQNPQDVQS